MIPRTTSPFLSYPLLHCLGQGQGNRPLTRFHNFKRHWLSPLPLNSHVMLYKVSTLVRFHLPQRLTQGIGAYNVFHGFSTKEPLWRIYSCQFEASEKTT